MDGKCICASGFGMNLSCPIHKPLNLPADRPKQIARAIAADDSHVSVGGSQVSDSARVRASTRQIVAGHMLSAAYGKPMVADWSSVVNRKWLEAADRLLDDLEPEWAAALDDVARERDELKESLAMSMAEALEQEELEALMRRRELPFIRRWQQETGKGELVHPDYGDILRWIMDKADAAESEAAALRERVAGLEGALLGAESRVRILEAALAGTAVRTLEGGAQCWCPDDDFDAESHPLYCRVATAALGDHHMNISSRGESDGR